MHPIKKTLATSLVGRGLCLLTALLAHAQTDAAPDAAPDTAPDTAPAAASLSANATLTSQYISRGFRQSWGKPALQAGADYAHPGGWSLGTWASTVSDRYLQDARMEWDLYGGHSGTAGELGYSLLAYYYQYPGAVYRATGVKYDYGELSLGLTYRMVHAKYHYTVTRDYFGIRNARGTGYLEVGAHVDLGGGLTLNLHAGDGRVAGAGNAIWNWRDAKAGVSKALDGGWTVSGAWTRAWGSTDVYDHYTLGIANGAGQFDTSTPTAGTFVLAVNKTF